MWFKADCTLTEELNLYWKTFVKPITSACRQFKAFSLYFVYPSSVNDQRYLENKAVKFSAVTASI